MQKQITVRPGGTLKHVASTQAMPAAGAFFQVPPTKEWEVHGLVTDTTTTATVGNRVLCASLVLDTVVYWRGASSGNVAASQVGGYDVQFGSSTATSTTVRRNIAGTANTNVQVLCACPYKRLKANTVIYIDDTANIDVTDATTLRITYNEYEA